MFQAFYTCFYSFQAFENDWENSEKYCQQKSGNLVSMETEEEYQFINKRIRKSSCRKQRVVHWFDQDNRILEVD